MRVMFAASDRDLVQCCTALLRQEGYETDTAFDGVQVLTKLSRGSFDLLILHSGIQRVEPERILENCRSSGVPTLALLSSALTLGDLLCKAPANAYLELPFRPNELIASVGELFKKLSSDEELKFDGLTVKVSSFELNGLPITAGETDVLAAFEKNSCKSDGKDGVIIASLNEKLARLAVNMRIEYRNNEGYRLVTINE